MNQELPKVSVIIPHYNMHDFLPRAVKSVINQQYKNVELIIVNDGSDKELPQNHLPTNGIIEQKLLNIEHSGKPKAVNRGFEVATGDYFVILDADDELTSASLLTRINRLINNGADLCIGSFETRYKSTYQALRSIKKLYGSTKQKLIYTYLLAVISPFHQNAMMFRRDLLDRVGMMDPNMTRGQDKDFAIRLVRCADKIVFIPRSVYIYNRYERPIKARIYNRCIGMKYLFQITRQYTLGWKRKLFVSWNIFIQLSKLIHDLFRPYRK